MIPASVACSKIERLILLFLYMLQLAINLAIVAEIYRRLIYSNRAVMQLQLNPSNN